MNFTSTKLITAALCGTLSFGLMGQNSAPENDSDPSSNAAFMTLNPFEVSVDSDDGYSTAETLDGTRFRSNMKDVPAQVSIMTKEFLQDIAAVTIEEAYRYSANIENLSEYSSAGDGDYAAGVLNFGGNRIRGLSDAGRARDFFRTTIPRDSYNIERISISSGPNAILFGNANPGGVVNTVFMRADASRSRGELGLRVDNYGSLRGSVDVNQPLFKDKLGLRVAGLASRQKFFKEPAYTDEDRFSVSLVFKPTNSTTIRAYYEDAARDAIPARNTYVGDLVTPWIEAGRPAFDNRAKPYNLSSPAGVFANNGVNQTVMVLNSAGNESFLHYRNNSVLTRGPDDQYTSLDNYAYTVPSSYGESLYPYDLNIYGDGTRNAYWGDVRGVVLEQRLPGNGYFEVAYNQESFEMWAADTLRGAAGSLYADANLYLPDGVTPNPDFGRYYVETGTPRIMARMSEFEEMRAQLSYDLDFTGSDGVAKWLGRHRLAGMFQRSEFVANTQQEFQSRLVPNSMSTDDAMNLFRTGLPGGNDRLVRMRYYLDDPATAGTGTTFSMPFNALTTTSYDYGNGRTYWGGPDNPFGGTSRPTIPNERVDSLLFASQSFFWEDRLVVSYGYRRDKAGTAYYQVNNLTSDSRSGYESLLDVKIPDDFGDFNSGDTTTLGAVGHVLPWLSLFYNQSSTWNPSTQWSNPDDGSAVGGSIGDGKDYGVMMRFLNDRVSLRINRYTNTNGPAQNVPYRNAIVPEVQAIERYLIEAAEDGLITPVPLPEYYNPEAASTYQETTLVSELDSKGYEFSLTANPTRNWRLTLNGAQAESTASDIGGAWINFIQDRSNIWAQYPDVAARGDPTNTVSTRYLGIIQTLNQMNQADGQKVEQGREWRFNLVSRYSFTEGALKGFFTGGGLRWRSKPVLGYSLVSVDNAFPFAGAPSQLLVPALDAPIWGESLFETDGFVGYSRKLNDRVKWRIQLNIRNLFDDTGAVAQRANLGAGFVSRYYIPEPRSFVLTNTLTF